MNKMERKMIVEGYVSAVVGAAAGAALGSILGPHEEVPEGWIESIV